MFRVTGPEAYRFEWIGEFGYSLHRRGRVEFVDLEGPWIVYVNATPSGAYVARHAAEEEGRRILATRTGVVQVRRIDHEGYPVRPGPTYARVEPVPPVHA